MKNATVKTIYAILTGENTDEAAKLACIRELEEEFAKAAEKAAGKQDAYEAMWAVVCNVLSDRPLTVAEIFERGGTDWPEDTTTRKISYGLTHQWAENVVKIEGKPNQYRRKI